MAIRRRDIGRGERIMPKQRLTRRGWIVLLVLFGIFLWFISTQVWWNSGGLCIGDVLKCMNGGK